MAVHRAGSMPCRNIILHACGVPWRSARATAFSVLTATSSTSRRDYASVSQIVQCCAMACACGAVFVSGLHVCGAFWSPLN